MSIGREKSDCRNLRNPVVKANFYKKGIHFCLWCTFIFQELIYYELKTFDLYSLDPKGGELYWIGLKEWETILEDLKRSDAQIDVKNSVKRRKTHRATW